MIDRWLSRQADTCLASKNHLLHIVLNGVSALSRPALKAPPLQDKSLTMYPDAELQDGMDGLASGHDQFMKINKRH